MDLRASLIKVTIGAARYASLANRGELHASVYDAAGAELYATAQAMRRELERARIAAKPAGRPAKSL